MAQEYISQASEEIEDRVTKKLPKELSRMESRTLGALSKPDEFRLNPHIRTCSVADPGTSRNTSSENREPSGHRSIGNPCPEAVFSTSHFSNLNDPEQEETHHIKTGGQEEIPYFSPETSSGTQKKRAPQVSHIFAVETLLRQLNQTRYC